MNEDGGLAISTRQERPPGEGVLSKDLTEIKAQAMKISRGNSIPGRVNKKCKGSEAKQKTYQGGQCG